jgi:hypothetical protein
MRKLPLLGLVVLVTTQLTAQKPFKRNTIYGEICGSGVVLSINYELQVKSKPGLGFYGGVGLGGEYPAFPLGAKYLFSLGNQKSFLECGAGVVFAELDLLNEHAVPSDKLNYRVGFTPCIGYRHHSPGGFMYRFNYTPFFSGWDKMVLFAGISVGWRL